MVTKKSKKSKTLPLKEILAAINLDSKNTWKDLNEQEKKDVSFWLLNRWISSKEGSIDDVELAVVKTNEYYNKNFTAVYQHPELLWKLLCVAGKNDKKKIDFHPWIPLKSESNKIVKLLMPLYPNMKIDEIHVLASMSTKEELQKLIKDHALDIKL